MRTDTIPEKVPTLSKCSINNGFIKTVNVFLKPFQVAWLTLPTCREKTEEE